ncbi:MAG: hypothetical protein L3J39_10870 [Verrucomicrobiales bacterium]|nr:hypothetical protein [Verrucomicrobiales bacterium]
MPTKLIYISALCSLLVCTHAAEPIKKNSTGQAPYVATNKDILIYTKQTIGTTVGRGECWDLAQQALDFSHSIWQKPHRFGFPLKKNAPILAGDIIQFQSARFEWVKGNSSGWKQLGAPNHTAIIYAVKGKQLQLAHQNVNGVRKVLLEVIDLKNLVSGTYQIYRPYKKAK